MIWRYGEKMEEERFAIKCPENGSEKWSDADYDRGISWRHMLSMSLTDELYVLLYIF